MPVYRKYTTRYKKYTSKKSYPSYWAKKKYGQKTYRKSSYSSYKPQRFVKNLRSYSVKVEEVINITKAAPAAVGGLGFVGMPPEDQMYTVSFCRQAFNAQANLPMQCLQATGFNQNAKFQELRPKFKELACTGMRLQWVPSLSKHTVAAPAPAPGGAAQPDIPVALSHYETFNAGGLSTIPRAPPVGGAAVGVPYAHGDQNIVTLTKDYQTGRADQAWSKYFSNKFRSSREKLKYWSTDGWNGGVPPIAQVQPVGWPVDYQQFRVFVHNGTQLAANAKIGFIKVTYYLRFRGIKTFDMP